MPFLNNSPGFSAASVGGIAAVDCHKISGSLYQISIIDVSSGSAGTVTLTCRPAKTGEYHSITDGTLDLSDAAAVKTFLVEGALDTVRAASDDSGDDFTLLVGVVRV
jgi:hypothetical protein